MHRVDVYKNLHKGGRWSVRDRTTGRVLSVEDKVVVENVTFIVQPAGRQKVLREQRKNVHAFVRGDASAATPSRSFKSYSFWRRVCYNPYKAGHFCFADTGEKATSATIAVIDKDGVWVPHTKGERQMKDAAEMPPVEALTLALKLAITAPTEEKSKACVAMANGIIDSNQLTGSDIQAATRMAQHQRDAEEGRDAD